VFALSANLQVGWRIVQGNPKYAGGSIAHIGLAVMFLGFVGSSKYDDKQTLSLAKGKTVEALGCKLTYTGFKQIDPVQENLPSKSMSNATASDTSLRRSCTTASTTRASCAIPTSPIG